MVRGCGNFGTFTSARPIPKISGYKFNDLNGNGGWNSGEPGVGGWTVQLRNSGGGVVATTTTDAGGFYRFFLDGLGPDTYSVTEVGQAGWVATASPGPIGVGYGIGDPEYGNNNFGNYHFGSIAGRKFDDRNGNGVDNADPGVANWPITLTGTSGGGSPVGPVTISTDLSGNYQFNNLPPGTYSVNEGHLSGWVQTYPQPIPSGNYTGISLSSGQARSGFNFGNYPQTASVSGRKFEDMNANGPDVSDPGVPDWPITLTGTDGLGNPVGPETIPTDPDGNYQFNNLPPGSYTLTEGSQPGWAQSYPLVVPAGTHSFTLISGEHETDRDFGNYRFASVSGRKYNDLNADGDDENGNDPGLPSWTIHLDGTDGMGNPVHPVVQTDVSGDYIFNTLAPGSYAVTEEQQPSWHARQGIPGYPLNLISGDNITDIDFGNWQFATVSGLKYDDLNGNGQQDAGEPPLQNWTIHLDGANGLGDMVHRSEVTAPDGSYTLADVVPGDYDVTEDIQPGWRQTEPLPTPPGKYPIHPTSGASVGPLAFGNYVPAEVHGMKFNDMNENGAKDAPGDGGLGNWQMTLAGADGFGNPVSLSTVTAPDGTYAFVGLAPGVYTICEVNANPVAWFATKPAGGGCYTLTLQSHDVAQDIDFGNFDRSSIAGVKYFDTNKDGVRNGIDSPLAGWVITLTDCNGNLIPQAPASTPTLPGETSSQNPQTTGVAGGYQFGGLHYGTYCVDETPQSGWVQTMPCFWPSAACGYTLPNVTSGSQITGQDFGNFHSGSLKVPEGNANNVDASIPAANLWLCLSPAPCDGPGEGDLIVVEHAVNVHTGDSDNDNLEDGLGAYEFQVEYDHFVIQSVNPQDIVFSLAGAGAARGLPVCSFSLVLENVVRFGCVTSGPSPAGPTGDFDLAKLDLVPHPDLANDLFPGNDNGAVTVLKDNGCEFADVFGHPATASLNGGLTLNCGDLAVTVRILEGDMNLDCKVDVTDEQLIATHYSSVFGSAYYSTWFDLEPRQHDLDVDIKDLQKVFGRDGSTCQQPVPAQPPVAPPVPFGN